MINRSYSPQSSFQAQRGAMMLAASVLLLVLVTLGTLYTGRIKTVEHQITLNTQNYKEAFAAAEAGSMKAFGRLMDEPRWNGAAFNELLVNQSQFNVTGVRQEVARNSATVDVVTITAVGTSADGLANVTVIEQALQYSVLANPPDVPLIVAGGLAVGGNFEVAANPNGGGTGVPLSIWTDLDVDLNNGSGTTCGLQEFTDGNCSSSPYSEKGFKDLDILDNDPSFPTDLMEYLFNVPEAEWATLRSDADLVINSCAGLNAATSGLIWMDGDCHINAGTVVGSTADPVILIVTDGDLTMNGGAEIHGMVFSFRKPGVVADFEINMIGGAQVNGVVASNHPVGHANGTYNAVYDADVLAQLELNDTFQRVARIPGSWRDF
ncbi:PilX N-terminal domain-containing pilus assembly protein [Alteromonas facilis]|uniref:PilX N-terminal domain-containing pilus assembly protein n=1 Tax=Alteromonas facilis TaxID=2048004 RepID=UPI000C28F08B|nr:PilX N-terminal domain-containing pilus assembly protein [Alteromonas facilis]